MLPTNVLFLEIWKKNKLEKHYVGLFQNKSTNEMLKSQFKAILHIFKI